MKQEKEYMYFEAHSKQKGVTLIETIIGVAVFAIISFAIYQSLTALLESYAVSRVRFAATHLFTEEMEIVRNLKFEDIGTVGGVPPGVLAATTTKEKEGVTFGVSRTVRNIDDPFDGTIGGSPNDLTPADYRLVEVELTCVSCAFPAVYAFTGRFAAKGLESATTNGSLFVQVVDANGQPVSGANVSIVQNTVTPPVNVNDATDVTGFLKFIDTPPAVQSYQVTVSKPGYSGDKTYATSTGNPNPAKPHATVATQQLTQITFTIDHVSSLEVQSSTDTCSPVPDARFTLAGEKLIGSNPNVLKFQGTYTTDGNGEKTISNLEWDTYALQLEEAGYDLAGIIPLFPLTLSPSVTQNVKLILALTSPSTVLVTVEDATNGLPLSGASVRMTGPSSYDTTLTTGRGFLHQSDWSSGSGAALFSEGFYNDQDGNIETSDPAGVLTLASSGGVYAPSGILTSSIFDTGSTSNFWHLSWTPSNQPSDAGPDSLRLQLATATTSSPISWNFVGPDGSAASYYTAPGTLISAVHSGDQYLRYRAYLGTANTLFTPTVFDVSATFSSDCIPPGQVLFSGLSDGAYTLTVSRTGYADVTQNVTVDVPSQGAIISMTPTP